MSGPSFKKHLLFRLSSVAITLFRVVAILALFNVIAFNTALSQEGEIDRRQVERIIEELVSELDPEESEQQIAELVEWLQNLASNPMNINRTGADQLAGVPGLDLRLARNIISYRVKEKPFETVRELLEVSGIGEVTYRRISPFLTVGSGMELGRDLFLNPRYWTSGSRVEAISRLQTVLEEREGYRRPDSLTHYAGSPLKYNHRYRYTSDRLSLALTQDKDPGEPVTGITGFDYTSWHAAIQNVGILRNLVAGDFRVSYGQGLILWNGGAFGKSSQVRGATVKNDPGIRPYTSSQETNAFRGIAVSAGKALQLSGFYSNRKRTASEIDNHFVRFPTQSGLHRTQNERARRQNLGQKTYGGRLRYNFGRGIVGVSGYQNHFNRPVMQGTQPYQIHRFEGTSLAALSTDFRWFLGPVLVFAEAAQTDSGGKGTIGGTEFRLNEGTDLALAYRNYSADFQSIFGSGFGEQTRTQNEEGFYFGLEQSIGRSVSLRTYFDQYRTYAPRFRNSRPTSGYDGLARMEYFPHSDLNIYAQYRFKRQEQEAETSDSFGRTMQKMSHSVRSNLRIQAEYRVHPTLRLRTRFDIVRARETADEPVFGMLLFQDARITPTHKLTLDVRITMFETDDFNSRVFQFENDLLYVMSNTMLFDQGQRMYLLARYQPIPSLTIRMKAATTLYENRTTIGSGLNEIRGNRRTDVGIQVRLLF